MTGKNLCKYIIPFAAGLLFSRYAESQVIKPANEVQNQPVRERIRYTRNFDKFAIREVEQVTTDRFGRILASKLQVLENERLLWEITADELPIKDKDCKEVDVSFCADHTEPLRLYCHNKCIITGPELLAFDGKSGKMYFYAAADVGQIVPHFIFVADLGKKEIVRIPVTVGPVAEAILSPSGRYLALAQGPAIEILDTQTNKNISTIEASEQEKQAMAEGNQMRMESLRWPTDNRIMFVQAVYPDKSSNEAISSVRKTFDVKEKKLVEKRRLK